MAAGSLTILPTLSDVRRWRLLALLIVVGGNARAPLGGIAGVREIGDRRQQADDAQGAGAFARPHGLILVLVAEAVFFRVGDQDHGGEDKRAPGLFHSRSHGEVDRIADAGAVERLQRMGLAVVIVFSLQVGERIIDWFVAVEPAHVRSPWVCNTARDRSRGCG